VTEISPAAGDLSEGRREMLENRRALLEKIRLGEDSFLELKEVRFAGSKLRGPAQDVLADELAAFANTAGGVLLLGIEDTTREVLGIAVEQLDTVELVLQQACEQSIKPALAPIIERMTLPDRDGVERPIIRVEVGRSLFVHLSPGGYLHRVGSSKRPIPPDHLARLFQQHSQSRLIRFDETPVHGATLDHLQESLWRRFVVANIPRERELELRKLAMAVQNSEGNWRPTVTGLLLGSKRALEFLPSAYIQAVAYRGTSVVPQGDSVYQLDARDITGPLDQQIHEACDFVRKNMQIRAFKRKEGGRVDIPQFSMRAVFEAITNAVAHRDYSIHGAKIRIRLFSDRLEIHSPGMLPNSMDTDSMDARQSAGNEAISSLLARCPIESPTLGSHRHFIMDRRGEGVPIIFSDTLELSGQHAIYRVIDQSELLLTIPASNPEVTT
jgi:predicted HTH transcriptional regulator